MTCPHAGSPTNSEVKCLSDQSMSPHTQLCVAGEDESLPPERCPASPLFPRRVWLAETFVVSCKVSTDLKADTCLGHAFMPEVRVWNSLGAGTPETGSPSSSFPSKAPGSLRRPCFAVGRCVSQVWIRQPRRWEPQEMWSWEVVRLEFVSGHFDADDVPPPQWRHQS